MMENKQPCAQDDMGPINSSTVYAQYSKKKKQNGNSVWFDGRSDIFALKVFGCATSIKMS